MARLYFQIPEFNEVFASLGMGGGERLVLAFAGNTRNDVSASAEIDKRTDLFDIWLCYARRDDAR